MNDGRWRAAVSIGYRDGKPRRKTFTASTRGEVADALKKALRDQQQGKNIMPDRVTLQAHLERWLTDVVKPSCSFKTHETYSDLAVNHLVPGLGNTLLSKLTTAQVQRFLNEKHNAGLSPKTVKQIRDCLRAALNVAVNDWELIPRNPASKAKPPAPQKTELRVFDLQQARSFLDLVAEHRLNAPVLGCSLSRTTTR